MITMIELFAKSMLLALKVLATLVYGALFIVGVILYFVGMLTIVAFFAPIVVLMIPVCIFQITMEKFRG